MRRFSSEHLVSEVEGRAVQGDSQEYLVYYTSENDLPSLVRLLGSNKAGGSDLRLHKLKKSHAERFTPRRHRNAAKQRARNKIAGYESETDSGCRSDIQTSSETQDKSSEKDDLRSKRQPRALIGKRSLRSEDYLNISSEATTLSEDVDISVKRDVSLGTTACRTSQPNVNKSAQETEYGATNALSDSQAPGVPRGAHERNQRIRGESRTNTNRQNTVVQIVNDEDAGNESPKRHTSMKKKPAFFNEIAEEIDSSTLLVGRIRALLHEFFAKQGWNPPVYECLKEEGPPHRKLFTFAVGLTIPGRNFVAFKGKEMRDHKRAKDSVARFALMWLLSEGFIIPAQWASLQPFK